MEAPALIEHYRGMARYNRWMNDKTYGASAKLSDEERRRDRGAFFRSIHGTLNHILLADRIWMRRFTGQADRFASRDAAGAVIAVRSLAQELYSDFDELSRQRAATDGDIEAWIAGLDGAALGAPLEYRNSSGTAFSHPLWYAVSHFFNHQTHHRGQVTTLLTQAGVDVGVTDLAVMLRDG